VIISCFTSLSERFPGLASSASSVVLLERDAYGYGKRRQRS